MREPCPALDWLLYVDDVHSLFRLSTFTLLVVSDTLRETSRHAA